MAETNKKQVPVFTMELRADDPRAVGTIKNRMRQLTLSGDRVERDRLKVVVGQFDDWRKEKEKVARATA